MMVNYMTLVIYSNSPKPLENCHPSVVKNDLEDGGMTINCASAERRHPQSIQRNSGRFGVYMFLSRFHAMILSSLLFEDQKSALGVRINLVCGLLLCSF